MTDVLTLPGDSTIALLTEGYLYGHRRFEEHGVNAFRTRLRGESAVVMRGRDAARFFYEGDRFTRDDVMPRSVLHSLQDEGSVQTLSGEAHTVRRGYFTRELMHARTLDPLIAHIDEAIKTRRDRWAGAGEIAVVPEFSRAITRGVLQWLQLTPDPELVAQRAMECEAMIVGAGRFGPRNWRGRILRRRTEEWAKSVIVAARESGEPSEGPLRRLLALSSSSTHGRGEDVVDDDVLAVELLNLLRPAVAVARFVEFGALAMHRHPHWRPRLVTSADDREKFSAEVRRATPFFPVVAGRAQGVQESPGVRVEDGELVILDIFATNRHPAEWRDAWSFDPDRFDQENPAWVVAQGAGDYDHSHRCPGEPATDAILQVAIRRLAEVEWAVAGRDLRVNLNRFPTSVGWRGLRIRAEDRAARTPRSDARPQSVSRMNPGENL